MKKLIFYFLLFLFSQTKCFSWNDLGHMIIANIAYENLDKSVKEEALKLLEFFDCKSKDKRENFLLAATWLDNIRRRGIYFLTPHVLNIFYDPENILPSNQKYHLQSSLDNYGGIFVINNILHNFKNYSQGIWEKALMLKVLLHLIGDLHNPMHCINYYSSNFPNGDYYGCKFRIKIKNYHKPFISLHELWDCIFLLDEEKRMKKPDILKIKKMSKDLMEKYPNDISLESAQNIKKWVLEVHNYGIYAHQNISLNDYPTKKYLEKNKENAFKLLTIAGYRLAKILNCYLLKNPKYLPEE